MSDRELLELAAKAAGVDLETYSRVCRLCIDEYEVGWNPLTDDGDALRLAVKLERDVKADFWSRVIALRSVLDFMNDPYAATRRAIVRAAAEIGRAQS